MKQERQKEAEELAAALSELPPLELSPDELTDPIYQMLLADSAELHEVRMMAPIVKMGRK